MLVMLEMMPLLLFPPLLMTVTVTESPLSQPALVVAEAATEVLQVHEGHVGRLGEPFGAEVAYLSAIHCPQ
jgi:hypothetical protein